MINRPFNFSPGPATLPEEVLKIAKEELLSWQNSGMSVMEMSHRGADFMEIYQKTIENVRLALKIPENFKILFMQGGGQGQNAIVPLNLAELSDEQTADFVITGTWSQKSLNEAKKYCLTNVVAIDENFTKIPEIKTWKLTKNSSYVHICSNETIHGVEFQELPDLKSLGCDSPLVVDFSSNIASRPFDWTKIGLAFGGAQKNLGPAGVSLVVIREDLIGRALNICPSIFNYENVAKNDSMFNTPPTWGIYMLGLNFAWILKQKFEDLTGVEALEQINIQKSNLLYEFLDNSEFYENKVNKNYRSRMNIPFFLKNEELNSKFLTEAKENNLLALKGHKSVGGMRASLYNAMTLEGVKSLVEFMQDFKNKNK